MKITLVNPPRSLYDCDDIAPPLGLLTLATVARQEGVEVSLVDLNLLVHLDSALEGETFYDRAVGLLLAEGADCYGFTSMAVDSHVALHLARLVKEVRPDVKVILGGSHFSSIATEVVKRYKWIDNVMMGEAEQSFGSFINCFNKEARVTNVSPSMNEKPPFPAYDLLDLDSYFTVNPRHCFNFEGGRGCRFKCAFCYSPRHYTAARSFPIPAKIEELSKLRELGARHVFFVEDNFVNDPHHALTFCNELKKAQLGLTWNCYVTLPLLSDEVIKAMSDAGCVSVFMGVDAVGAESQRLYHKSFFRDETLLERKLMRCVEGGITPTCAFLLSPPSHPCGANVEQTLRVALSAANAGARIRLNTLTMYNQTGVLDNVLSIRSDATKVQLMLDVPPAVERNDYAEAAPELFPFHSRYVPDAEWEAFVSEIHCLFTLFLCYPRTLQALWTIKNISPNEVANRVLHTIDKLLNIKKILRREHQLLSAIKVFEQLTAGSTSTQSLLEVESENLLTRKNLRRYQIA